MVYDVPVPPSARGVRTEANPVTRTGANPGRITLPRDRRGREWFACVRDGLASGRLTRSTRRHEDTEEWWWDGRGRTGAHPLPCVTVRTPRAEGGAGTSRAGPYRWERSVAQERDPPGVDGWRMKPCASQPQNHSPCPRASARSVLTGRRPSFKNEDSLPNPSVARECDPPLSTQQAASLPRGTYHIHPWWTPRAGGGAGTSRAIPICTVPKRNRYRPPLFRNEIPQSLHLEIRRRGMDPGSCARVRPVRRCGRRVRARRA